MTLEGSLTDIPAVVKRETREQAPGEELLGTSSETTYMEIPNTHVKTVHKGLTKENLELYKEQKKQVGKKC